MFKKVQLLLMASVFSFAGLAHGKDFDPNDRLSIFERDIPRCPEGFSAKLQPDPQGKSPGIALERKNIRLSNSACNTSGINYFYGADAYKIRKILMKNRLAIEGDVDSGSFSYYDKRIALCPEGYRISKKDQSIQIDRVNVRPLKNGCDYSTEYFSGKVLGSVFLYGDTAKIAEEIWSGAGLLKTHYQAGTAGIHSDTWGKSP